MKTLSTLCPIFHVAIKNRALLSLIILTLCLVQSVQGQGTQPVVAIHDSELTRALATMPAVSPTPTGFGTTGFQWWPTAWNYFVMPEAAQEMLRSDGTAFTVIKDSDISAGLLLPDGSPKYPIIISLASEAMRDDEIAPLTNYVAAGGFLMVGSSSFTRRPDGTSRGDFAFANAMGVRMTAATLANWADNLNVSKQANHRIVSHMPSGELSWRMPSYADEISWPEDTHLIWRVQATDATVIARGETLPYLTVKKFGKGYFIYHAGFQPLIAHGGFGPGMYAYTIFRNAIEWAYESSKLPVMKLSPWPYQYDAAFLVRHDLENYADLIADIEASAQVEKSFGAKGDYYFCTGTLRENMPNPSSVIASLQRAMTQSGATIGSHNGGLKNPFNTGLNPTDYDYWHWGLDDALDVTPPGYPNGKAYARASLSNSFVNIETWLPGLMTSSMRVWVAPYFNATREDSYDIQQQLNVKVAGEQKLGPFPHWTVSTRTSGKRYPILSQPASDWFVGGMVAQSLEPWHPPGVHSSETLHEAIDFYYGLGGLINIYSHTLSTGEGDAGMLVPDYIAYCTDSSIHPRMWAANAIGIYNWWTRRSTAAMAVSYATNGNQMIASMSFAGATDANTAVEIVVPALGSLATVEVYLNGQPAAADRYRINDRSIKLLVGTTINNAQVVYTLGTTAPPTPTATSDFYGTKENTVLNISAPGVLANDSSNGGTGVTAALAGGPANGSLILNANGSFTYTPANGYIGNDGFTYQARNGLSSSATTPVLINVTAANTFFSDNFTRPLPTSDVFPWVKQSGSWALANNALTGSSSGRSYGFAYYQNSGWTDYRVSARIQFSSVAGLGAGIGGRLNPTTGAHYAAWVYPDGSPSGANSLKLVKFTGWGIWSGTAMQTVALPSVGTGAHTLAMTFQGSSISVSYDGNTVMNVTDSNFGGTAPFASGGITTDLYTEGVAYTFIVDDVMVTSLTTGSPPVITTQPVSRTNTVGTTATFNVAASGSSLSYQWRFNSANIAGATASSYSKANVQTTDAGDYTVVVSNPSGSVTSSVARLTVTAAPPAAPVITTQPASRTNTVGTTATFNVVASGSSLSYQWRFNSANIAGATASSYSRANVQLTNAGDYTVVVSNPSGSVTSSVARLTVTAVPPAAPVITTQPASRTNTVGSTASFSVGATGSSLSYQWRFNGNNIAGATTSTYSKANVQTTDAGDYTVIVSNPSGSVTSSVARLTIIALTPPTITTQPQSRTTIAGQSTTFSVTATGSAPLAYQWRFNGANIAGATGSSCTIANVQAANVGSYTVVVSNGAGSVTSSAAALNINYTLTITTKGNGSVTVQPLQASYAPGTQVTLTANPNTGNRFVDWTGSVSSSANPITITVNSNMTVKATFSKKLIGRVLDIVF